MTSKDPSNNSAASANAQFTTTSADTTAPVVSAVSSGTPTYNSATITATTNENAVCNVDYGLSTSYGTSTNYEITAATSHSISLTGLTASTSYNYKINCKDGSNNSASSTNQTFTTSAPPDTTAPTITAAPATSSATSNSIIITWTTNEAGTSVVQYGLTTSYEIGTASDSTLVTSHSTGLSGLTISTTYNYKICSSDQFGNGPTCSANATFATSATADTTAPATSSGSISSGTPTASSTTVTFTTNELSVCQLKYGTTTAYGLETNFEANFVTSHSIALSNLSAGSTYHFSIVCKDASGNVRQEQQTAR